MRSMREYLSMMTPTNYPGLSTFINVVIGISVIIGFIVIFQAMYTAVMERTREIGILKSMGASKFYIVNVILRETVLLAVVGVILWHSFQSGRTDRHRDRLPDPAGSGRRQTGSCAPPSSPSLVPSWARFTLPIRQRRRIPIDALAYE